jgi:hypothetical protein
MGVSGQRHAPAALYPGEMTPGTHWTGSWVSPRAEPIWTQGLEEKSSAPAPAGDRTPIVQPVVRHYTAWAAAAVWWWGWAWKIDRSLLKQKRWISTRKHKEFTTVDM